MRLLALLFLISFSFAQLKVVVTYPWIGYLVKEIGGNSVKVHVIAKSWEDPHFVVPKPSHLVHMRNANLLIVQGASLEVGFLPPLLQQSANPNIQPGRSGFLDLSMFVNLIERPTYVSRAMGDVHPEGNPHYQLDPDNIPTLAKAIAEKLCQLDEGNCTSYKRNLTNFLSMWERKSKEWNTVMANMKGTKVVSYHKLYDYFLRRYNMILVGTLEPLPGIPPNPRHLENLIETMKKEGVKCILQDVYHDRKAAQWVSSKTGVPVIVLPHDGDDLVKLFDTITAEVQRCR